MRVIPSFNPAKYEGGVIEVGAVDPGSKLLLYNMSLVTIQINFDNGSTTLLHAGEANYWILDGVTPEIEWQQYQVLNAVQSPISQVTGIVYSSYEQLTGTYPMSFIYSLNVGNPQQLGGSTIGITSITNDGNPAGMQILEATVAGDPASNVVITNDGKLTLGNAVHPGQISVDNGNITSDGTGVLTVNTLNVRSIALNGSMSVSTVNAAGAVNSTGMTCNGGATITGQLTAGSINAGGAINGGAITGSSLNTSGAVNAASAAINGSMSVSTVNAAGAVNSTGMTVTGGVSVSGALNAGSLNASGAVNAASATLTGALKTSQAQLALGSIARINKFSGAATGTYNHGLGVSPDIVILSSVTSTAESLSYYTVNSTQTGITSTNGTSFNAVAVSF